MKAAKGFTYIEVVVSILIVSLLLETMWIGFHLSERLSRQGEMQVEASYYSEELLTHIGRRMQHTPVGATTDLISYLSDAETSSEAISERYGMARYDYYVVMVDKTHWQSTDKLLPEQVEVAAIMSTLVDNTRLEEVKLVVQELMRTEQVKLVLTYDGSLNATERKLLTNTTHIGGIELTLIKEVKDEVLQLTVTSSQLLAPTESSLDERQTLYLPLDEIAHTLGAIGLRVKINNETSYPLIIEDSEEGGQVAVRAVEEGVNRGHITYSYEGNVRRPTWAVLCIVLRKGGTEWGDVIKKQLVML